MKHQRYLPPLLAPLLLALLAGCEEAPPVQPSAPVYTAARAAVLYDIGNVVIVPAIVSFDDSASALRAAIDDLNVQRTPQSLEIARRIWRSSRRPWELSEAFLFGPARNQQLDPTIDSWPLDRVTLDGLLAGGDAITAETLALQEGTAKGFHAIEFLLFGETGSKQVDAITDREYQYLRVAAGEMADAAGRLRRAWMPRDLNDTTSYQWQLWNAGNAGSLYRIQGNGLSEVINRLASLCGELAEGKMGNPYYRQTVEFEEARFSGNSKADFAANVEGIRAVYLCEYRDESGTVTGKGLSTLVAEVDPGLDAKVRAQLDQAARMVEGITPSFGDAVKSNRTSIAGAMAVLGELQRLLDKDVREVVVQ